MLLPRMNWRKSYLLPDGSTENLKTAIQLEKGERNAHHKRAKWAGVISLFLMLTVFALPIGLPLFLWATREANKAERLRTSR